MGFTGENEMMSRKGQVWIMDFILGLVMFLLLIAMAVQAMLSLAPNNDYDLLYTSTVLLSDSLISGGHPVDWNSTHVILPGVIDSSRINITKLERMQNLSYDRTKGMLHLEHQYLFYFENGTGIVNITNCVYGYPIQTDADCNPLLGTVNYDNLVKIERIVIYNGTIVKMVVYGWK